jgi:CheY-like chemotaxis protein
MADILVVDDEKLLRVFVSEILQRYGHNVRQSENGADAMDSVNKEKPDIIITDIFMPEKSGLEVIMEIRKNHPEIKIIAMSGDSISRCGGHMECLGLAQSMGSCIILEKPFAKDQLVDAVNKLLDS